jgi:hypothetical protein
MSSIASLIIETANTNTSGAMAVAEVRGDMTLIDEMTAIIKK